MTEGDNEDFNLRLYSGTLNAEVVLRVRPLTLSGFEAYRRTSSRTFAQSIIDDIDDIPDPAECEYYIMHCVHYRYSPPARPRAGQKRRGTSADCCTNPRLLRATITINTCQLKVERGEGRGTS